MKRLIPFLIACGLAAPAFAGSQQAGAAFFPLTKPQTYARSDGLFQHKASRIPVLIGNGDGYDQLGPQMRDTFAYGDGLGLSCEVVLYVFIDGTGTGAACDATCAALTPDAGCVMGYDEGSDVLVACDGGASEGCLCETPIRTNGLDDDCGDIDGSTGNVILISFGQGMKLAYHPIVVQLIAPDMDADSLDLEGDITSGDGVELASGGIYGASGRPYIVGDDPAFQFCIDIEFAVALASTADFHMGWRQVEEFNATFDSYNTYATIGLITTNIVIETEDDGGGTTTTDTDQDMANATRYVLCTKVSDAGVVTYTIDGQTPQTTVAYTFDDGTAVIPFVHLLQAGTQTGEADLRLWEVKYQ